MLVFLTLVADALFICLFLPYFMARKTWSPYGVISGGFLVYS